MNLAKKPSQAELASLLAQCDDNSASHVLWVSHSGEVHLDSLPAELTPIGFERFHQQELKFRWETFIRGNDYVGPTAAKDKAWVAKLFAELEYLWKRDFTGYSDAWQASSLSE